MLGGNWGPTNGTLSFYECRLSRVDSMRWWELSNSVMQKNLFQFFARMQNFGSDYLSLKTRVPLIKKDFL